MKVGEAAKILGVATCTVRNMIKDGLLEAEKVPRAHDQGGPPFHYELLVSDVYLVAEVLRDLETRRGEILRYYRQGYSIDWIANRLKIQRRSAFRALNRAGIKFDNEGRVVCDRAAS